MKVRIAGISAESVTDGPGVRLVVFFQGCPHACTGCHNPETWAVNGGKAYETADLMERLPLTPILSGLTFSGGDPFVQAPAAAQIAGLVKARSLNLWVYTGYVWEDLLSKKDKPGVMDLISLADVIVDGPFQEVKRDLSLVYRGSSNQRFIDVRSSLAQKRVVLWADQKITIPNGLAERK